MPKQKTQGGNAFIIILVGIFLFGALMFTFTRSGQKGSGNLTKQQSKIAAQEILNYARLVEGAVDRVRRNGCSESEISFENAVSIFSYVNTNAPLDKSCHVFEPEGGKLEYIKPQEKWLDDAWNVHPYNAGNWGYGLPHNNLPILGIGTIESDLRWVINFVNKDICVAINDLLGVDNPSANPPIDCNSHSPGSPQGSFSPPVADIIGDDGGHNIAGKTTFCREGCNDNVYQFTHVLLAR